MARKVFFSFHFQRDCRRVNVVRNAEVIGGLEKSVLDRAEWEKVKRNGDDAVRRWIDSQLKGTSVTAVLVGRETGNRKWVKYEVQKSIELGKGLIAIDISKIKDTDGSTANRGPNPVPSRYPLYLWNNGHGQKNLGRWIEKAAIVAGK
jgi:hypothetical protein